jgi:hypothetical protein
MTFLASPTTGCSPAVLLLDRPVFSAIVLSVAIEALDEDKAVDT